MAAPKGRRVAILTGIVAISVLIGASILFRHHIEEWYFGKAFDEEIDFSGTALRKGRTVYISEGVIPLVDFLKFLSDFTGYPLVYDSRDTNLTSKEIRIPSDIPDADAEVVKAILEVNGVRIFRKRLPGGKEILRAESMDSTAGR